MDPELSCEAAGHASRKDWMTGLSTFGELKGGTMARCSLMHARSLIKPGSLVLNELGGSIPFEIAIGANGVFWVNSASPEHTVAIVGAVKCSETMDGAQTKSMVREIINDIRK
jgi:exosome complex component RRP40